MLVFWWSCKKYRKLTTKKQKFEQPRNRFEQSMVLSTTSTKPQQPRPTNKVGKEINDSEHNVSFRKPALVEELIWLQSSTVLHSQTHHPLRWGDPPHRQDERPTSHDASCGLVRHDETWYRAMWHVIRLCARSGSTCGAECDGPESLFQGGAWHQFCVLHLWSHTYVTSSHHVNIHL